MSGRPSLAVRLAGRSPATDREELVTVMARELQDGHVVYMLLIAPADIQAALSPTFDRMIRTLQVNENASHR